MEPDPRSVNKHRPPPPPKPVSSLRNLSIKVLRAHVSAITDIGEVPYELIESVLIQCPAPQLRGLEHLSPHLIGSTEGIWKELCVHDFVKVKAAVEDGKMVEPPSWRELHAELQLQKEEKMAKLRSNMRSAYSEHSSGRATSQLVNGVSLAKRRKTGAQGTGWSGTISARPKSLLSKARADSARIRNMYAKPTTATKERKTTALAPTSIFAARAGSAKPVSKPPVTTVVKKPPTSLPPPTPISPRKVAPLPSRSSASPAPPPLPHSSITSFQPFPITSQIHVHPAWGTTGTTWLPMPAARGEMRRAASSSNSSAAGSPPPPSVARRAAGGGLFMPKKARPRP